jgi:CheY-like chemotaxis protein
MNASHSKTILLIDDDPISIFISTSMLQNSTDFKIVSYTNAMDALDQLEQWSMLNTGPFPEIIYLDINMPIMDGWEFLDEFQKFPPVLTGNCCVVMLTSSADLRDVEKAKSYSMVKDFISKPLTGDKIISYSQQLQCKEK